MTLSFIPAMLTNAHLADVRAHLVPVFSPRALLRFLQVFRFSEVLFGSERSSRKRHYHDDAEWKTRTGASPDVLVIRQALPQGFLHSVG